MPYTEEFELPIGYEDKNGEVHKTCVMRRVTNQDLIRLSQEPEMRELAKSPHKLNLSSFQVKNLEQVMAGEETPQISGDFDPVAAVMTQAATALMNSILFAHVVLKVGSIEKPKRNIFQEMHPEDMAAIDDHYTKMNTPDVKPKTGDKKPVPLGPSVN